MKIALHFCSFEDERLRQQDLLEVLSDSELERANRFRNAADRMRYALGKLLLRQVLSAEIGTKPGQVVFKSEPSGKPYSETGPSFNLSHSGSAVLVGIAESGNLGVDIELVKPLSDLHDLARHCFSDAELAELEGYADEEKTRSFFRAWTRKEALVKALGGGLGINLKSFSVSLKDETGNVLNEAPPCCVAPERWTIRPIHVADEFEAAVACDYRDPTIQLFEHEVRNVVEGIAKQRCCVA